MYESRHQPLLPRPAFLKRLVRNTSLGLLMIASSLLIGMFGYRAFEHLDWLDAFLNASMLLGGMGPVEQPQSAGGKLFAGLYALYCGLIVIVIAGVIFAPVVHRFLHKFHLENENLR